MFLGAHTKQRRAGVRCLMRIEPSRTLAQTSGGSPRQPQLADANGGLMSAQIRLRRIGDTFTDFSHVRHRIRNAERGRQVKLPERARNTSQTVPEPYQTVGVVFTGMVQAPELTREAIGRFHWSEL